MLAPFNSYIHEGDELLADYRSACEWLNTLGLRGSSTRYAGYEKFLLGEEPEEQDDDSLRFIIELTNAQLEASELLKIHSAFYDKDLSEFKEQISKALKGKEFPTENDSSRNFLFELSIASRFLKAGFSVHLTADADVFAIGEDGVPIIVECKRLKSVRKIGRNVKRAAKQVEACANSKSLAHYIGLIAVDMTELMQRTEFTFPATVEQAQALHGELSRDLVLKHQHELEKGFHPQIMGVLCQTLGVIPCVPEQGEPFATVCRGASYFPYRESTADWELAQALANQDYKKPNKPQMATPRKPSD
jgi:hypothetical protein